MGKTMIVLLGLLVALAVPGLATAASDEAVLGREAEDVAVLVAADDDDDDSNTGAGDTVDGTDSRYTSVSRDGENSRGGLTRDRTNDGAGGSRVDRSAHSTNDRTRNDTR